MPYIAKSTPKYCILGKNVYECEKINYTQKLNSPVFYVGDIQSMQYLWLAQWKKANSPQCNLRQWGRRKTC